MTKNYTKAELVYFLNVQVGIAKSMKKYSVEFLVELMDYNKAWDRFYSDKYVYERKLAKRAGLL